MLLTTRPDRIDPELTERFAADLDALWPLAERGGARLGLAVSGGADSLALLLLAAVALRPGAEVGMTDAALFAGTIIIIRVFASLRNSGTDPQVNVLQMTSTGVKTCTGTLGPVSKVCWP